MERTLENAIMRIGMVGTGYVGTIMAVCLADLGHRVICHDVDAGKIDALNKGLTFIYEAGLGELLQKHAGGNLTATLEVDKAVQGSDVAFICVDTPPGTQGKANLGQIANAATSLAQALRNKGGYYVVTVCSTVPPGTTEDLVLPLLEEHSGKRATRDFGVGMSPEFISEGKAVENFMRPDRIVIGSLDQRAADALESVFRPLGAPILHTDLKTAEMIKYVANAFLATKISFANELGNVCKKLGIDTHRVMDAIGYDRRIGPHFLNPGVGFGGSCLPKDLNALISLAQELGHDPALLRAVREVNEGQPRRMMAALEARLGDLKGRKVALLGLSFKEGTDDIRGSPAIALIELLRKKGASISAYDPVAEEPMRRLFPSVHYCSHVAEALEGADACLVLTAWSEFSALESEFQGMKTKLIIEGRRVVRPADGVTYEGLSW